MQDIHVRVGTPEDLEGCMSLFVQANEENGIDRLDPEKLLSIVWPSLHQDGGIIGIIGDAGNRPEGVVLLRVETLWYSNAEVVAEKLVYIHPDFRIPKEGGRSKQMINRPRKLCEFSKKVSDELGLPLVIGIISNQRTQSKIRLYERIFGEPAGAFFLYNGKTGLSEIGHSGDS